MIVLFIHNDFRLYWPPRLIRLREWCGGRDIDLRAVEVAGKGGLYSFAAGSQHGEHSWWHCLYPDRHTEELPAREVSAAIYRKLEQIKPDVVFAAPVAFPAGATAARWARRRRRPLVIFDNARLQDVPRTGFVNWVKRRVYRNVDGVLTAAPSHRPDFEAWGMSPSRIFYGVDVVDNDAWAALARGALSNPESTRSKWELPEKYFLAVGRQVAKKNLDRLIQAYGISRAASQDSGFDLVIVGDGPLKRKSQELVHKYGIAGVHFHPFRKPDELGAYYALSRGLVLPSLSGESWGMVVNEAMACGLPVLVSRECGCSQTLVHEGSNGWTFDPLDHEALAKLLARFERLEDSERSAMGQSSRRIIAEWGLDRFVDGVQTAIQAVKEDRRGFAAPILDRVILSVWNGRYRPT